MHPAIQKRLRPEIMLVLNKHNGQLINDGVQEMAYRRWHTEDGLLGHGCVMWAD